MSQSKSIIKCRDIRAIYNLALPLGRRIAGVIRPHGRLQTFATAEVSIKAVIVLLIGLNR
ncbi:hypothetical protein D3C86_2073200 [compost metagenome]